MFSIETPGEVDPPIFLPFASCVLLDDGEPLINGYVDAVEHSAYGARLSRTRITGRSKTGDLIDCMP